MYEDISMMLELEGLTPRRLTRERVRQILDEAMAHLRAAAQNLKK